MHRACYDFIRAESSARHKGISEQQKALSEKLPPALAVRIGALSKRSGSYQQDSVIQVLRQ